MSHLDENTILAFVEGALDPLAIGDVDTHVAECVECRQLVVALAKEMNSNDDSVGAGTLLGRYILLYRIGNGAMGMVFSAYDPKLDRKIAVKLLRTDLETRDVQQANARLVREGRAVARLAHPNVIAVHDVGTHNGAVFIAMEEIVGSSLSSWSHANERSVSLLVDVVLQAGAGLAAAHRSGLVHRDFKPANVLVGDDGRVRVGDFGLARISSSEPLAGSGGPDDIDVSLTRSGTLLGTPRYMAPELFSGGAANEKTDQYSFAASAWETLHGEHPFDADSIATIQKAIKRGPVATGPRSTKVSASIRRVLKRALAVDPIERFPSMEDLLVEIRRAASRRKRVIRNTLMVAVAVSLPALLWVSIQGSGEDQSAGRCERGADRLTGVWDAKRQKQTLQPFMAKGTEALETFKRVRGHLDQYRLQWISAHERICKATHVYHEQSDTLFDLKMQCLGHKREALQASVSLLTEGFDDLVLVNAVAIASGLPRISDCDDTTLLLAAEPRPSEPQAREEVDRAQESLHSAEAFVRAGKFSDALAIANEAVLVGAHHSQASLEAKALFIAGNAHSNLGAMADSETALLDAASAAALGRDDVTSAKAWTLLVGLVGYLSGRPKEGLLLVRMADAAIIRVQNNSLLRSELFSMQGLVMDALGRYDEAKTFHLQALEIREKNMPADSLEIAVVLDNLGAIPYEEGKYAEAEEIYRRALMIRKSALGSVHPDVAASLNGLGAVQAAQNKSQEARDSYEEALDIWRSTLGPEHPNIAAVLNNLANLVSSAKDYPAAEAYLLEALSIWGNIYDGPHANLGKGLVNLGIILHKQGRFADAEEQITGAIEMQETLLGAEHPDLVSSLEALAKVVSKLGRPAEAAALLKRSSAIADHRSAKD